MNPDNQMKCGCDCSCKHHFVTPISIILIGLAFLAGKIGWLNMDIVDLAWPFLLIVIGVGKFCSCCNRK